jgi:hypothetical protein
MFTCAAKSGVQPGEASEQRASRLQGETSLLHRGGVAGAFCGKLAPVGHHGGRRTASHVWSVAPRMQEYRLPALTSLSMPRVSRDATLIRKRSLRTRNRPLCSASATFALLACLALPSRVLAEPNTKSRASDPEVAAAQKLFEEGRALMKKGQPGEACPKFQESQHLDPGLGTQFNLANCLEQLGKLASAHALFTEVADAARASGQVEREQVARARADEVEPRLTKLAILVPAGSSGELKVVRDGVPVAQAEWGSAVPVDPGIHRVRASGPDLEQWTTDIDVPSDGAVHQVMIPNGVEESFLTPLNHKLALAAAGLAVVGLGAATYFSLHAVAQKNEADAAGCQGQTCPTQQGVDLRHQASRAGNLATLSMTVGVVGLATAAALLWVVPELGHENAPESASLELMPVAAPGVGALLLGGSF